MTSETFLVALGRYGFSTLEATLIVDLVKHGKRCWDCECVLPPNCFGVRRRANDGLNDRCRACVNSYERLRLQVGKKKKWQRRRGSV